MEDLLYIFEKGLQVQSREQKKGRDDDTYGKPLSYDRISPRRQMIFSERF